MEYTLDAILIFIFILIPGIIFRRFYFQGEFTKQYNSKTLAHSLSASILPGIIIQICSLLLFDSLVYKINGKSLASYYSKISNKVLPENIFDVETLSYALLYFLILVSVSWLLAFVTWKLIRVSKADRWMTIARFQNHWNYYFKGEIKGFRDYRGLIKDEVLGVKTDILVKIESEEPRLYTGVLSQYTISRETNQLEQIYLTNAGVYKKNDAGRKVKRDIPGDIFILNASNIININLRYITTPKKKVHYSNVITPLSVLILIPYIAFTDYYYLISNTVFKTILLKIFFVIYTLFLLTFLHTLFRRQDDKKKKWEEIKALSIVIIILSVFYYIFRYLIF